MTPDQMTSDEIIQFVSTLVLLSCLLVAVPTLFFLYALDLWKNR